MAKPRKKAAKKQASFPWLWIAGLAVVILVGAFAFIMANQNSASAQTLPLEVSTSEAFQKRAAGAFVLDVREQDEWNSVHIPGATLIPLGQLPDRLSEVPKDQQVVVVCHSGNRSATGRDILLQAGFQEVTSMRGGMNDWIASGYPTVTGP